MLHRKRSDAWNAGSAVISQRLHEQALNLTDSLQISLSRQEMHPILLCNPSTQDLAHSRSRVSVC